MAAGVTVTGSRRADLAICVLLATLIIAGSYRLRVYYRAPAARPPAAAPAETGATR